MEQIWNDFIEPLYCTEYDRLFKTAYCIVHRQELAQDLVHEVFLLAIFHHQELMRHPNPGAWLMVTLRNLLMNTQRSPAYREVPLDEAVDIPQKAADCPIEELLPVQLDAEEREILVWRFERQMGYQEMAQRLHISEDACRQRLSRAVKKCRKYLRDP